ncbi:MAG: hypothetical protein WCD76_17765 [Pyrinomonadaceae bacterium]
MSSNPSERTDSPPYSKNYKTSVATQLQKLRLLGLLAGRDDEADEITDAWTGALWKACVPIHLLAEMFQQGVEGHRGDRSLSASEVIRQWRGAQEAGRFAQVVRSSCDVCDGTGFIPETRRENGFDYSGVRLCGDCTVGQAKRRYFDKQKSGDN